MCVIEPSCIEKWVKVIRIASIFPIASPASFQSRPAGGVKGGGQSLRLANTSVVPYLNIRFSRSKSTRLFVSTNFKNGFGNLREIVTVEE